MIRIYHGTTSKKASKIVGNEIHKREGFRAGPDGRVYFAEDVATARFFATGRAAEADVVAAQFENPNGKPKFITVVELEIEDELASEFGLGHEDRLPLGEATGQHFPDVAGGSGFERMISHEEDLQNLNAAMASGKISVRRLKYPR
jgi:hypothetical protein